MKLIDILKHIERDYDFESDMPVRDYDIRPNSVYKIRLCFMREEETHITVSTTHPILRQYYYAEIYAFYPREEDILECWVREKDWFTKIIKKV